MRLAAIFCVWHDYELLREAKENLRPLVDGIIIVASNISNYGEFSLIPSCWRDKELIIWEPNLRNSPLDNETNKRNYGLSEARRQGYTHFVMCDSDEFYKHDEFSAAKERFNVDLNLQGLVCPSQVFFKHANLTIGFDVTLVPFIHRITQDLQHCFNRTYPKAWVNGQIRIDPSRSLNINSGVEYTEEVVMFHMSYIRRDLKNKINNSTAKGNILRSSIFEDYRNAKPGYFCKFYQKTLIEVPNYFNLPIIVDKSI